MALVFALPVIILSMFQMNHEQIREFMKVHCLPGLSWSSLLLLLLSVPVQFVVGAKFYKGAFQALKHGTATMDVLVALGSSAAFFFSVFSIIYGIFDISYEVMTTFETSVMVSHLFLLLLLLLLEI